MLQHTLEHHFNIFKEECEYWLNRYGFGDYEVVILHEKQGWQGTCIAWQVSDHENRWATLGLCPKWMSVAPLTDEAIRSNAFHEINELLLNPLDELAKTRLDVTVDRIDGARHGAIMRLHTAFFKQSLKERGLTS